MKEFGSDYHFIKTSSKCENTIFDLFPNAIYLADGRQTIELLVNHNKWKRIWIPEYFCWEIIEYIGQRCKVEIQIYEDNPLKKNEEGIEKLSFQDGDVLLKMNYFGFRKAKYDIEVSVPVIEDYSHDIYSEWVRQSKADYCIASLRKTLPSAGGGIIWSNTHNLSDIAITVRNNLKNEQLSQIRWEAMKEKADYLSRNNSCSIQKDSFRNKYIQTENMFDNLSLCSLSTLDKNFLESFDIANWYQKKLQNWGFLVQKLSLVLKSKNIRVLSSELEDLIPFSLILLFPNRKKREQFKKNLIRQSIYPAVLWQLPESCSHSSKEISNTMLSIHCDGRYRLEEISELGDIIYNLLITF